MTTQKRARSVSMLEHTLRRKSSYSLSYIVAKISGMAQSGRDFLAGFATAYPT